MRSGKFKENYTAVSEQHKNWLQSNNKFYAWNFKAREDESLLLAVLYSPFEPLVKYVGYWGTYIPFFLLAVASLSVLTLLGFVSVSTVYSRSVLIIGTVVFVSYSLIMYYMQPYPAFHNEKRSMHKGLTVLYSIISWTILALYYIYLDSHGIILSLLGSLLFIIGFFFGFVLINKFILLPVYLLFTPVLVYLLPVSFAQVGYVSIIGVPLLLLHRDGVPQQLRKDDYTSRVSYYLQAKWYILSTGTSVFGWILLFDPSYFQYSIGLLAVATVTTLVVYPWYRSRLPTSTRDSDWKTKADYFTVKEEKQSDKVEEPSTKDDLQTGTQEEYEQFFNDIDTETKTNSITDLLNSPRTSVSDKDYWSKRERAMKLNTIVDDVVVEQFKFEYQLFIEEAIKYTDDDTPPIKPEEIPELQLEAVLTLRKMSEINTIPAMERPKKRFVDALDTVLTEVNNELR